MSQYMVINTMFFLGGMGAGMPVGAILLWIFVRRTINKNMKQACHEMIDESVIYYLKQHGMIAGVDQGGKDANKQQSGRVEPRVQDQARCL